MRGLRYVYCELHNEQRMKKVASRRELSRPAHHQYKKNRQTMSWRLQHFARKQDYKYVINSSLMQVQELVRDQYREYEENFAKYWGGGKYFKKMGRMDKVRYKENLRMKKEDKANRAELCFEVFHEIDVKFTKWIIADAFFAIKAMKKPIRNTELSPKSKAA